MRTTSRRRAGISRSIVARLRWAVGAAGLTISEPADGLDRALQRAVRLVRGRGGALAYRHETDSLWEAHLHERLGHAWPCEAGREFEAQWAEVNASLEVLGLPMGRGTYGGWDDGDRELARSLWCLVRHLRPRTVVETGVARGITSRVVLESLERNGIGHLWSIDLPALEPSFRTETGAAVPDRIRGRWTYLQGTSRRRLPGLLAELGELDLFIHDSSHTARNLRFELEQAWAAVRRGAIVADDIDRSNAFAEFVCAHPEAPSFSVDAHDRQAIFGIILKGL